MASRSLQRLRAQAVSQTLFSPAGLAAAVKRMSFVQFDPIRAPARAQDLILRHRVKKYRAGDLERRYPSLDLEEDYLYAYGVLPRRVRELTLPRKSRPLLALEKRVLAHVRRIGEVHPKDLEDQLGGARVKNNWGGVSKATTKALEELHTLGHLRVARRRDGIRLYDVASSLSSNSESPKEKFRKLATVVAKIFAPAPEASLTARWSRLGRTLGRAETRRVVDDLYRTGELERRTVDGVVYVSPTFATNSASNEDAPEQVRFLAPFDPLVWDRARFEHLWGWKYRFEAYTPKKKRVRGYYAMPLLWRTDVIGWVNARVDGGKLDVDLGFVEKRPRSRAFASQLEGEVNRVETFLQRR